MRKTTGGVRYALQRYAQLPPWVLLAQLFLGIGWLRAGIAHAFSSTWWDGGDLVVFVDERREQALPIYQLFLDRIVVEMPAVVAVIVLVAEFGVGLALLASVRRLGALAVGCFLNVHFIAAGQVNPSIFYLVISLSLAGWLLESEFTTAQIRSLARAVTFAGMAAFALLAPAVDTMSPASVIEDPASVLIFLVLLIVGALWASYLRRSGAGGDTDVDVGQWFTVEEVVAAVEHRTGFGFSPDLHATVARKVGVRPAVNEPDRTIKGEFAIYVAEADRYLYSRPWVDALSTGLATEEGYRKLVDELPRPHDSTERAVGAEPVRPAAPPVALSTELTAESAEAAAVVFDMRLLPDDEDEQPGLGVVVRR